VLAEAAKKLRACEAEMEHVKNISASQLARAEAKREADMREFVERTVAEIDHLKRMVAEKEALAAQSKADT
jgi:hypothetical protein